MQQLREWRSRPDSGSRSSRPSTSSECHDLREGFSLLEIVVAVAFLTVVTLGISLIFVSSHRAKESSWKEATVTHAFRHTVEQIRATKFSSIASIYQGFTFDVPSIGGIGTVQLFLNETDGSEDALALGLPMDLDGDGIASSSDVSSNYILMPIKIEITWLDSQSGQEFSRFLHVFLSEEG